MYAVDIKTFLKTYKDGYFDVEALASLKKDVKKPGKRFGKSKMHTSK
jgi:hypothetical protein